MKINHFKLIIFIIIIMLFSGCTFNKKITTPTEKKPNILIKPSDRYYYFTEAQLKGKMGKLDDAILYLEKAIEKDPESSYLQRELASLYLQKNDNPKALSIIERVLKKDPNSWGRARTSPTRRRYRCTRMRSRQPRGPTRKSSCSPA